MKVATLSSRSKEVVSVNLVAPGCTYRVSAEFRTWAGVFVDPPEVKFQSRHGHLYGDPEEEYMAIRDDTGRYHYDYTVPRTGCTTFHLSLVGLVENSLESPTITIEILD